MADTYDFITKQWGCVPRPEREAAIAVAANYALVGGYTVKEIVTALFLLYSPAWYAARELAWSRQWNIATATITISGVDVVVYVCNRQWMRGLRDCRLAGGCSPTAPYTAPLNFVNAAVPLTP